MSLPRSLRTTVLAGVAATVMLFAACGPYPATDLETSTPQKSDTPTVNPSDAVRRTLATATPPPTPAPPPGVHDPLAFSNGAYLLLSDLVARGVGPPASGAFSGEHLVVTAASVDAPIAAFEVPYDNPQFPPPPPADVVAFYDFPGWDNVGGVPGVGGNAIFYGAEAGVFAQLNRVVAGDAIEVRTRDGGLICYRAEFNKIARFTDYTFDELFGSTPTESITLFTGEASSSERRVAWGRRADCTEPIGK